MAASDEIPTLAQLRGTRAKRTPRKGAPSEPTLFDARAESVEAKRQPGRKSHTLTIEGPDVGPKIWTVGDLVRQVRGMVERSYGQVSVEGEISNWRPAASGHCYFTLKDRHAQLSVVIFRRQASLLRFAPRDGDAVRLRGQLSVYESRGQMQLVAEWMEQVGMGALLAAVRELKDRLRREGLFDRKRTLPGFPRCIGVVTSLQGAALRDIVKVCRRRHATVQLLIYPAAVQGPRCASEIAAGVRWFSAHADRADVVIVARGGGSWEDLHGFDDEQLARAIAASAIPVITGIGHATDTTIADSAADVCAPTPSAAAELVTAAQHQIEERVARLHSRLQRAGRFELLHARQRLLRLRAEMVLQSVSGEINRREQRLDDCRLLANIAMQRTLREWNDRLAGLDRRMRRLHVSQRLADDRRRWERLRVRLRTARWIIVQYGRSHMDRAESRLQALSPLRVLERGYALVYIEGDGRSQRKLLRSAEDVRKDQTIVAQLASGSVRARVTDKEK